MIRGTRAHALGLAALVWVGMAGCSARPIAPSAAPQADGLRIEVTSVPASTPPGAAIHVAGSFNGWNPADPRAVLQRTADGRHWIALPAQVRGPVEFKFTLGSWDTVEQTASGDDAINRSFVVPATGGATYAGSVAAWRDPAVARRSTARPTVSILSEQFAMPQLDRQRRVWIYLPPDYASSDRTYPVLYMHDGQNLFDAATSFAGEWGVDETLDSLHVLGDPGVIVVGIDHAGERRFNEYAAWGHPEFGTGEGGMYVEFLVATLKPYVDTHFRTRPDRLNTAVAGSSMGGLISLYAALRHPEVFGHAGVFSPALWVNPQVFDLARSFDERRPQPRFFFVSGGLEGSDPSAFVREQARMVATLEAAGFAPGTHVEARVRDDGTHSEWFWRREFPAAYQWLFRRPR